MDRYGVKIKGILKCGEKFLIMKKWYDDRIEEPYQWEFLDTTLQEDETPEYACLRFVQESTGIYAQVTSIPYTWAYKLGDNQYIGIAFLCEVEDETVILSDEYNEFRWVRAEQISEYVKNRSTLRDMQEAGIL